MSGNTAYSPARDLTASQPAPGPGIPVTLNWMCGHKRSRAGGLMKGYIPWKCAACVEKKA